MKHILLHASDEQISAYVEGRLDNPQELAEVEAHIADCNWCRRLVVNTMLTRELPKDGTK